LSFLRKSADRTDDGRRELGASGQIFKGGVVTVNIDETADDMPSFETGEEK
jgi:hypothetical protein